MARQPSRRRLEVSEALPLLANLHDRCLTPLTRYDSTVGAPANLDELLSLGDCGEFRATASREHAEWPRRYILGDTGWRWDFERIDGTTTTGRPNFRLTLRPDSILLMPGPIVERDGNGRVRVRERDDAPWHVVTTPVPTMRRVRECVLLAARMASQSTTAVVFEYLPDGGYTREVCPDIAIKSPSRDENGDQRLEVLERKLHVAKPPFALPLRFRLVGPTRFELRGRAWGQRYLLDADGQLHVTTQDREAATTDPAPERCEEQTTVPCDGP